MLGDAEVSPAIAVKDMAVASQFYGETLGLEIKMESPGGTFFKSGSTGIFVYPSSYAGTNQATYAGWVVDDVEALAKELKGKGVQLEHYDMEGVTREGDIHIIDDVKAIWFKDPDGNILSVTNQMG